MIKRKSLVILLFLLLALMAYLFKDSIYVHAVSEGDIIITEIMVNPSAVADANGEWFEVYNPTGAAINTQGWTIRDDGFDTHQIQDELLVPAEGFAILGINDDELTNGGVVVDYEYVGFVLGNAGDEVVLESGGALVDQVSYSGMMVTAGKSMQLHPDAFYSDWNDLPENWCDSTDLLPGGDYGTPGEPNVGCGFPATPPQGDVGGLEISIDKFSLLVPYTASAALVIAVVAGSVYTGRRWLRKTITQ